MQSAIHRAAIGASASAGGGVSAPMPTDLLERIRNAQSLPALPATALEVLRLTQSEDSSVDALASAIERDPTLAAKLLRTVNSPLFGVRREVSSVKQAVALAGQRTIRVMALSLSLTDQIQNEKSEGFDYEAFWRSSLTSAVAGRLLGREVNPSIAEESFVAGLLSQIGRLAAHRVAPQAYGRALTKREQDGGRLRDAEIAVLGASTARLGRELLERWNLPASICVAVGASQGEGITEIEGDSRELVLVVHAACMVADLFCQQICPSTVEQVKQVVIRCTGIEENALEGVLHELDEHVRDTAENMSLQIGDTADYAQIRANAAMELAQLSMLAESERAANAVRLEAAQSEARQLHEEKKEILEFASTDALTKIANRAAFERRFEEQIAAAQASGEQLALLILDVDHFKDFNDTHGHQAGDEVLRRVAAAIRDACAGEAFPARYGGEEFIAVARVAKVDQAAALAEKIRRSIEHVAVDWNGTCLKVTASVGVATAEPSRRPVTGEKLIAAADEKLYEAKRSGRNRVIAAAA